MTERGRDLRQREAVTYDRERKRGYKAEISVPLCHMPIGPWAYIFYARAGTLAI